eukprot:CAMPEP_0206058636 /NCGR_PEP_ID=MMETSP1466-20131121/47119_1 /ASSEMBLY_ACC=CAM_ASM_001126 /TAXON_ID=44452 /ORGANISM="Pavlova gyrans, Strain CCMP608" /LENGTH=318 /DNA_ID=CAMNT_0053433933 /DNA_START=53 /DNA_END=1009 /DNA_ORIENTATION=+
MQQFGRTKTVNRDLPVSSRGAQQKWVDHCHDLHRHRLASVQPTVDNKWGGRFADGRGKQATYPHLSSNAKKLQLQGDKQAERELENYILLAKLSKILQRPPPEAQKSTSRPQSASGSSQAGRASTQNRLREAELRRIHAENLRIVHRIQSTRPHISVDALEKDYEQSLHIKEMISMFSDQRLSRGSSVVPSPRVYSAAVNDGSHTARTGSRPSSARTRTAAAARNRPNSASATMQRRRQIEASEYKAAMHDRHARHYPNPAAPGQPHPGPAGRSDHTVWSEDLPEEEGPVNEATAGAAGGEEGAPLAAGHGGDGAPDQ